MLIRMAIVLQDNCEKATILANQLETAVQDGEIFKVDLLSEKMVTLTDPDNSISITEDYWCRFVSKVRKQIPDFKTRYLFDAVQSQEIMKIVIDKEFPDIAVILAKAVATNCFVLQLPMEENE